ncbi:uncharacterized protein BDZ83DRAFT_9185 [Colletotrichum acutatum]|uniref:Uncharacterized protein n=1 Tax=Glomerella acutata TaxID=27357 RepID=A0AAD8XR35_GLOAC|nr:uncharacterized protein BDZ83DRAFT_9185 [Colletotrichum acutatum]KAK1731898.1 hypothetical protein BDZ83DRAFT_9185 [Colletotrichum acutatum]
MKMIQRLLLVLPELPLVWGLFWLRELAIGVWENRSTALKTLRVRRVESRKDESVGIQIEGETLDGRGGPSNFISLDYTGGHGRCELG